MKENLTPQDFDTPEMKEAVYKVLAYHAKAEVLREEVDAVQHEVLQDIVLLDHLHARHMDRKPERITDPKLTYLCEDEEVMTQYFDALDQAEREKGIKPNDMDWEHCPALVAEYDLTKAKWTLLDVSAEVLDMDFDGSELNSRLLSRGGVEEQEKFIDLMIGLVVNLPDKEK